MNIRIHFVISYPINLIQKKYVWQIASSRWLTEYSLCFARTFLYGRWYSALLLLRLCNTTILNYCLGPLSQTWIILNPSMDISYQKPIKWYASCCQKGHFKNDLRLRFRIASFCSFWTRWLIRGVTFEEGQHELICHLARRDSFGDV